MGKFLSGAVWRHEWRLLFLNASTPVFLGFAWVALSFLAFYAAPLFHQRLPLGPLAYVPWIFCLLLPLLTMQMADDERSGRLERLLTLPIDPDSIWLTRFVLYWLVAGLFLLGTWPLVVSAAWMGSLDLANIITGYGVVWLVGGVQLALAFWLAAESGHAVIAFLCGFLLNAVMVAAGWHYLKPLVAYFAAGPVPAGFIGDGLAVVNMLLMPVLLGLVYIVWRRRRRVRARG